MNKLIAAAFAASLSLIGATASQALPLAPMAPTDGMVTLAAGGCGPGYHPGPRGLCRPMRGPRPHVRPHLDHRPVIVRPRHAPPRPPVMRPGRACPPGYVLSRGGVCRPR